MEKRSLKTLNTFGIDVLANCIEFFQSEEELTTLLQQENIRKQFMILGGGSNILFCHDFDGAILKNEIKTLNFTDKGAITTATVGGGFTWHSFVETCVQKSLYGVENLALIPGTVGASPIQNIGAYGVEIKDVLLDVRGYDLISRSFKIYQKHECQLGYRTSIFKTHLKQNFIITAVTFKLSRVGKVNTAYKALHDYFSEKENTAPSLQEVFDAVCAIRRSKLPNPREIGNAGSFFKNPIVDLEKYKALKEKYPTLPRFTVGINSIKIPAAWLIENLGYKGTTRADANGAKYGVHAKQPLVLVNYGGASGAAILSLAHEIQERVQEKFDIGLEMEVNII